MLACEGCDALHAILSLGHARLVIDLDIAEGGGVSASGVVELRGEK